MISFGAKRTSFDLVSKTNQAQRYGLAIVTGRRALTSLVAGFGPDRVGPVHYNADLPLEGCRGGRISAVVVAAALAPETLLRWPMDASQLTSCACAIWQGR